MMSKGQIKIKIRSHIPYTVTGRSTDSDEIGKGNIIKNKGSHDCYYNYSIRGVRGTELLERRNEKNRPKGQKARTGRGILLNSRNLVP